MAKTIPKIKPILLCRYCIDAIRSRGEEVYVGNTIFFDLEPEEMWHCEWCEEESDDLYKCHF